MKELKTDSTYKGTRILLGNGKRDMLNDMIYILREKGFEEIQMPIIQMQSTFAGKVGEENNNLMFNFQDRGQRDVCLAPEYTAVVQQLAKKQFKYTKDVKIFYVQECFRGEKPQAGRYRQFTQLGVEIINPYPETLVENLAEIAEELLYTVNAGNSTMEFKTSFDVTRGLDYYKGGKGFEITCDALGSSKQVCGGGEYDGGMGFAIGIDRILKVE